jgi:hypothetical protein
MGLDVYEIEDLEKTDDIIGQIIRKKLQYSNNNKRSSKFFK